MARKRFPFPPTERQRITSRNAAFAFLGMDDFKVALPERRQRKAAPDAESPLVAGVPAAAAPVAAPLEAEVIRAVADLLAVHPRVAFAIRQNSGAASYEAKSGRYAPIWFHRWVRAPEPMKMADYLGATTDGLLLALECKRPSWTKPTDDRERKQAAFLALVRKVGGLAAFVTDARQVEEMLR